MEKYSKKTEWMDTPYNKVWGIVKINWGRVRRGSEKKNQRGKPRQEYIQQLIKYQGYNSYSEDTTFFVIR